MLGRYELLTTVGVGSTGTVWKATHVDLGRTAAVKVLSPGISGSLLQAEAHLLASLDHPNIVKVYDFVEAGTQSAEDPAWLAEEWVDGERVDEFVSRLGSRRLTGEQAVGIVRGALEGLSHAHDAGVVHGDVSAGNILVDRQGTSKLIDFGLASPTGSPAVSGTPAFMSPEAAQGLATLPNSDVYSAAAVLYFLLDGRPPFQLASQADLIHAHISREPPRLTGHGDTLASLLARAMAKDPAERPPDAGAFLAELETAAQKRFGEGWLVRASVVGLVAGPATAVTVAELAAGAGTAAVVTNGTPVITESTDDEPPTPRRRIRTRTQVAAGAGLVIAVGGAVIIASAASSSGGAKPAPRLQAAVPRAAPSVSAAATPIVSPVLTASQRLVGRYQVNAAEVNITFTGIVPASSVVTWTISKGCSTLPCRIDIHSSSGAVFHGSFNGSTLTFSTKASTQQVGCSDDTTGQPISGASGEVTEAGAVITLKFASSTSKAGGFSGTSSPALKTTASQTGCRTYPAGTIEYRYLGVRLLPH